MSKTYLGVDIGGTAVKLGLVDENGRVLRRAERSVSFDGYKTPILDTVQAAIHEFLTADAPRLEGIAVSATGQIDSRRGVVAGTCGNFPGWIGVDIKGYAGACLRPARHRRQRRQLYAAGRGLGRCG